MFAYQGPESFYLGDNGTGLIGHDSQHYVVIAKNLVEGNGYSRFVEAPFEPDALRTPLLPLYFIPFIYFFGFSHVWVGILLLLFILSFTPVVVYKLSRQLVSPRAALVISFLVALQPLLAYRSNIAEPDALMVLLIPLAFYYLVKFLQNIQSSPGFQLISQPKRNLYLSALVLGISTLAKPVGVYLAVIIVFFIALYLVLQKVSWHVIAEQCLVYFGIVVLVISPWLIRNRVVFGVWTVSSIATYNAYAYYTNSLKYPGEPVLEFPVREAVRNPKYSSSYNQVSFERIKRAPLQYAKLHLTGTVRNLLASDMTAFAFNGHLKLLPVAYSPDTKNIFYYSWKIFLALIYLCILKRVFDLVRVREWGSVIIVGLFLVTYLYFILTPATFVDAKYRLPALPLLLITFCLLPKPGQINLTNIIKSDTVVEA